MKRIIRGPLGTVHPGSVSCNARTLIRLLCFLECPLQLVNRGYAGCVLALFDAVESFQADADNLVLRICSFSYHRGLPKDESGNGGGFIFDGRSLPNPGREERFQALTGRDLPVIDYLHQQESVHQFLASVMSLVDASVSSYQKRGFKHLMVSFGCTGGQHRSVYLAEQVAKRLRGRNGVEVVLHHRELERMASEQLAAEPAAR